jgi:putative oxidoreductase
MQAEACCALSFKFFQTIKKIIMLKKFLNTDNNAGNLILRITLALVMFPHGAQKLLGWFGGGGFFGTIHAFSQMHIPPYLTVLMIFAESIAMVLVLIGIGTRLWALMILVVMLVAMNLLSSNGFFMNWTGGQKGEGIEYHLLVIGISLALIIKGAGSWSIDRHFASIKG